MKAYRLERLAGLDALKQVELPDPQPGPHEILVRMKAASLNYRDSIVIGGGYHRNRKTPLIPLSDGAGEVAAVGEGVTQFQVGDRVAGCFFQDWESGDVSEEQMGSSLGGGRDGVLAEYVTFRERGAVKIPEYLTYEEAATLPCAAVTAWQALTLASIQPGHTVLTMGTGGVSLFALQLAKAAGARVIITSSSDEKLARAKDLGADEGVNYRTTADWGKTAKQLTGGRGVDNVIELGGTGTLEQSLMAARVSGTVSLIGVLSGFPEQNPSILPALFNRLRIQGIYVGSRTMFQDLNRALAANQIQPVIDRVYPFDEARAAYERLAAGAFGKVVVAI